MNVSAVIKSIRNIMRQDKGVNGDAQRLEQIGWMLFLKIFDAKDEELEDIDETGEYVSPIPKEYQWRNWAANDEGITGDELITFIDRKLFPDLSNLKVQDNKRAVLVRDVFRGNNNYMKSGQLFRQVVNELNKIDFHASKDRHVFGQVYETILKELQSAGSSGEFYTPRAVTEFMTQTIDPKLGERILDPACGTGGFLTAAIEHIRKSGVENLEQRQQLQNSVHGYELKPLPHLLAVTNLILHGIEIPDIAYEDSLLRNQSIKPKNRVDVILANPPFGGNVDDATAATFPVGFRTKESADLFLVMMVNYLKQGGRAAIVLPDGSLTGDGIKARIREMLLRNCNLHTIVRLPNSVFKPYASVSTNLLFFERVSSPSEEQEEFATKEIWYYEHQLPEGSKGYSMTYPIKLEEFNVEKNWWNKRSESETAWKVNLSDIIEKAIANAKPHYEKEKELKRETYSLKEKISVEKTVLKDIDKKQTVKIEKQQEKIKQLESSLQETETKARIEKQTADNIYYAAFDLDIKNPNKIEEDLGDPEKLILKQDDINKTIAKNMCIIKEELSHFTHNSTFILLNSNIDRLIHTKSNVKHLRQTLLQLAITGKLSEDWRNKNTDIESAKILLAKIFAEKESLIKSKIIPNPKPLPKISNKSLNFELPDTWEICRLESICSHITDIDHKMPSSVETNGIKFISAKDINDDGTINLTQKIKLISFKDYERLSKRIKPQRNDIIYSRIGTVGKAAIVTTDEVFLPSYSCCTIRVIDTRFDSYLQKVLSSNFVLEQAFDLMTSNSVPDLGIKKIKEFIIPIPPIDEQHYIVGRVNQLMRICDELEKLVEKRDTYQERIMQAVVYQAFTSINE